MNVIILTTGLSGSSLITGLIAQGGFWCGDKTVYKHNASGHYETYENSRLVELNDQLVEQVNYRFTDSAWYDKSARTIFEDSGLKISEKSNIFTNFLDECNQHGNWVWKDPKLWLTIGYWYRLLDKENTKYIIISRDSFNLWVSQTSKRIIYDYSFLKQAEKKTLDKLIKWMDCKGLQYLNLKYETVINDPEHHLIMINDFLDTQLNLSQFRTIYTPQSRLSRAKRIVIAVLIYLKNYLLRIR